MCKIYHGFPLVELLSTETSLSLTPVRNWVRIDSPHPLVCRKRRMRPGKTRPVSQQVWHDKDPSLLKAPECQAKAYILQPFTGNGDEIFLSGT
jgi:hypothetical protein